MSSKSRSYPLFDCDNHIYEPPEALLRHLPEQYKDIMTYVEVNGRTKLAFNGEVSEYIPNPTFEVVAAPGCHSEFYRGNNPDGKSFREFNVIEKGKREYQYRTDERAKMMDEQGIVGALVYPSLANVIEGHMDDNPDFCHAVIHALNQWIKEEWGFGDDGVFYVTPVITFMNADKALEEARWIIENGSKVVLIRPAPVAGLINGAKGYRSMASPEFDAVWKLLEDNNIFVTFHTSDNGYNDVYLRHKAVVSADGEEYLPFDRSSTLEQVMDVNHLACQHHLASLICHGLFDRFPNLKISYVETGTYWVYPLWDRFDLVHRQMPQAFERHPHEIMRNNVFYHPFYEENVYRLVEMVGVDQVMFGSDWPHPEGLAKPTDWEAEISELSETDRAKIMGGNIMKVLGLLS